MTAPTPRMSAARLAEIERINANVPHELEVELLAELREVTRERDEARAAQNQNADACEAMSREVDRLAAKVVRAWQIHDEHLNGPYTALQKETHALRAEVERLKSGRYERGDLWNAYTKLQAGCAAMRDALILLHKYDTGTGCHTYEDIKIVRADALSTNAGADLLFERDKLKEALKNVIAVADRKTKEFDAARAALEGREE